MNLEKITTDSSINSPHSELSNGVHLIKDSEGGNGFISKRGNVSEWIPVAEGHDFKEAEKIVKSYHSLRTKPHEQTDTRYFDLICRKTQELSQPKETI